MDSSLKYLRMAALCFVLFQVSDAVSALQVSKCRDVHQSCGTWAAHGKCQKNPSYMAYNCPASCGRCMPTELTCRDRHQSCVSWAALGECHTNPSYMDNNCPASCRRCMSTEMRTGTVIDVGRNGCLDQLESCSFWAEYGQCSTNPVFMRNNCAHSCGFCSRRVTSNRKEQAVSLVERENENGRLESNDDGSRPEPSPGLKNFFGEILNQQALHHAELLDALPRSSAQAVVTAVKDSLHDVHRPDSQSAAHQAIRTTPAVRPSGLFSNGDLSEVLDGEESSDKEFDFPGWKFPEPVQVVHENNEPVAHRQETSTQPRTHFIVKETFDEVPRPESQPAASKSPRTVPAVWPSVVFTNDAQPEIVDGEEFSDNDFDFPRWNFPNPKQEVREINEPLVHLSGTSTQPVTSNAVPFQGNNPTVLDDGIFDQYDKVPWNPPPEILAWLKAVNSREVPLATLKSNNDSFILKSKNQASFTAPQLPQVINERVDATPKNLPKVPKIVHDQLLRAQKELVIAYKPLVDLLDFYYSPEFITLREFAPEIAPVFDSHKMMLSQGIALIVSAGIKISNARKDTLRPVYNPRNKLKFGKGSLPRGRFNQKPYTDRNSSPNTGRQKHRSKNLESASISGTRT